MINYYEILGLNSNAGIVDIKAAFRRLAKLYHPDKNPHGKDHFNKILRAYEILSDPIKKSTYDYRLKYQISNPVNYETKKTGTKNWRFDEKELKRRQYYNDYIKKQTAATNVDATVESKKNYNEYKYIFFATPLAVALFLSIMYLATPYKAPPSKMVSNAEPKSSPVKNQLPVLATGLPVYLDVFGPQKSDSAGGKKLDLINTAGSDVVVCLFSKHQFLRCVFIKDNEHFEVAALPADYVDIRYCTGNHFQKKDTNTTAGVLAEAGHFFKRKKQFKLKSNGELSLEKDHGDYDEVSSETFFKKE